MLTKVQKECKTWGIILLVIGVIVFFTSGIITGVIVLLLGLLALLFRKDWNLALIGGWFILIGGLNVISEIISYTSSLESTFSFYLIIGIIQLVVGIYLLIDYYKIGINIISEKKRNTKNFVILGIVVFLLIVLIVTWNAESNISIETENFFDNVDNQINNSNIYVEGVKSGLVTSEYALKEISEIEKDINETQAEIKNNMKYSILTYFNYGRLETRYILSYIPLASTTYDIQLDNQKRYIDYYSNQSNQIIVNEQKTIKENMYYLQEFEVYTFSKISIDLTSDDFVNFVLLDKFELDSYLEGNSVNAYVNEDKILFLKNDYNLNEGEYALVIITADNPANVNLIIKGIAI